MAGENGHLERPASPQELEEALDRLYKGTTNVAIQAADLGIPLERLKLPCGGRLCWKPPEG